jgi:hypothetical protein
MTSFTDPQENSTFDTLILEGAEKLVWITPSAPMAFQFEWEKVIFTGKLSKPGLEHNLLLLGDMGPLPFSAEDPSFRERLLKLARWQPEDRVKFVLEPNRQHIFLMIDDVLEGDMTGKKLLASAVQSLFHVRPYLELAKDVGWKHPSERSFARLNTINKAQTSDAK